jgi:hypothetical protein
MPDVHIVVEPIRSSMIRGAPFGVAQYHSFSNILRGATRVISFINLILFRMSMARFSIAGTPPTFKQQPVHIFVHSSVKRASEQDQASLLQRLKVEDSF